jgi:Leucine-rich repeat (LRR) protein
VAGLSVDVNNLIKKRAVTSCSKDYSPCSCVYDSVVCDQVSVKTIKSVFNAMTLHDLDSFKIIVSPNETEQIPDDVLGNVRVSGKLLLECAGNSSLRVAENALRESTKFIVSVTIDGCNLEQLNFFFMSKMENLRHMYILRSFGFQSFQGMPYHSNFKLLGIMESSQFLALEDIPGGPHKLERLYLSGNQLDDTGAAKLMKLLASNSIDSLTEIVLYGNKLTRIPDKLLSMPNLKELSLNSNEITALPNNSLAFKGPISDINLSKNKIKDIMPGAFGSPKSILTFEYIRLNHNPFNRLDSNVFQTVLEGMALFRKASLDLEESKFFLSLLLSHNINTI